MDCQGCRAPLQAARLITQQCLNAHIGTMCFSHVAGGALMGPLIYIFTTYMTSKDFDRKDSKQWQLINVQISSLNNRLIYEDNSCYLDSKYPVDVDVYLPIIIQFKMHA